MADAIVSVQVRADLLEALTVRAQELACTVEALVVGVLEAYVATPTMPVKPEEVGQAVPDDVAAAPDGHAPEPVSEEDAETMLVALSGFVLPADTVRLTLGDALVTQLGLPSGTLLTVEAGARLAAVTGVCERLQGTLTEAGVRRWWTRPRRRLGGGTPLELLGADWTPESEAFQQVKTLADSDAGFAAT
ncbi:hypothetical protein LAJ19_16140 (plasmid) [Deinococcus taeanensis]|uniref:hypothetical protein n=1 Tax=Deinococcus taeanensis TaxID=2737050 RepID=UPI001CDC62AE|nr:hypothetical protein [Deinococcus taeanensis]UBV44690.1 hypothetical protein LAJ19_16140 [Deinococcus taeanensis]